MLAPRPARAGPVGDHGRSGSHLGGRYAVRRVPCPARRPDRPGHRGPARRARAAYRSTRSWPQRFAEAGLHAIAIDYFGRTAGIGPAGRGLPVPGARGADPAGPDRRRTSGRPSAWLRQQAGVRSVYTVGFCFGGSNSWAQSAAGHDLAGCMGFYGQPARVADLVPLMRSPLLMLAAGADFTPVEAVQAFAEQAREAGRRASRSRSFPDAPHSFFDRYLRRASAMPATRPGATCFTLWTGTRQPAEPVHPAAGRDDMSVITRGFTGRRRTDENLPPGPVPHRGLPGALGRADPAGRPGPAGSSPSAPRPASATPGAGRS